MQFYSENKLNNVDAKHEAQKLAFAPFIFQATIALRDSGILDILFKQRKHGIALSAVYEASSWPKYSVELLLDTGLTIGLVLLNEDKYTISKLGYYVLKDEMTKVNMDFSNDVCYRGLSHLSESLKTQTPAGLKELGDWETIYQGLSQLTEPAKKSWFEFDHYYSDISFPEVLALVFSKPAKHLVDIGGNTGRWATACLEYDNNLQVTIVDLPGQLALAQQSLALNSNIPVKNINFYPADMLKADTLLPAGADIYWMSQFLDCFSEDEIVSILTKVRESMRADSELFIMELFWNKHKSEIGALALNCTSLYFTAMANGNSRMYHSDKFIELVERAGLTVVQSYDDIGVGHCLLKCTLK